jgi:Flp pilus assembly protein TadG
MSRHDERGAVTAELAMGLPLLLAVTVAMVWLLAVGAAQVRVVDASRESARALARGDDETRAREVAQRIAPAGARVEFAGGAGQVVVETTATVDGPGGLFGLVPEIEVTARAVALREQS